MQPHHVRVALSSLLLLGALGLVHLRPSEEATAPRRPLEALPMTLGRWQARGETPIEPEVHALLKLTDYVQRRYEDGAGGALWLYVGYWASQRRGSMVHSPRNCLPGSGWEIIQSGRRTLLPAQGNSFEVNRYVIQKEGEKQLVLYWYLGRGRSVASDVEARLELFRSAIFDNRTDGALVRLTAPLVGGEEATEQRLLAFARAMAPLLPQFIPD